MTQESGGQRGAAGWIAIILSALVVPLAATVAVAGLTSQPPWPAGLPAQAAAQFRASVFLLEGALLLIVAPLAGVLLAQRVCCAAPRSHRADARRPAQANAVGALARIGVAATPILVASTVLACASAALLGSGPGADAGTLATSHAALWAAAVSLAGIGLLCAAMFGDPLDAAATALVLVLSFAAAVFAAGPALEKAPPRVIDAALLASPIVGLASAASIDIFRTDVLYRLSPLAHLRFDYPSWSTVVAAYVATAALCLIATALQFERKARRSPAERIPV